VLARLDEIPGVRRSRAECSGHYFLVEVADGEVGAVAERAIEILGRGARRLPPAEAEAQHEALRRGEPWVTAPEARALSFVEGRMLGVRVSVREEMFAHVERRGETAEASALPHRVRSTITIPQMMSRVLLMA
jgi:hypothetical protein